MQTMTFRPSAGKPMEHRWGERTALHCPARLLSPDGSTAEGLVRDASISGAWIDSTLRLPVHSSVSVTLCSGAGYEPRSIELPACVVRTGRGGFAVEWRDMGVPTLIALLREAGGAQGARRLRERALG